MTETFARDGLVHDLDEAAYHADVTTLSSSGARTLATRTAAEFRYEQKNGRPPKREYDFGHLVHRMILGAGADIVTIEAADWRTKAAKDQRDEAYAEGKTPILEKDWRKADKVVAAFRDHPTASALITNGAPEVSVYWEDPWSGVACRGRIDWLRSDVAVDVKTTQHADPRQFAKSVAEYGYHQQSAWYLDGLHKSGWEGRDFLFVTVSVNAPYLVSVIRLDDAAIQKGRELNQLALERYVECQLSGLWPGHGYGIHTISLPSWAA